jgi:hypothetical protein
LTNFALLCLFSALEQRNYLKINRNKNPSMYVLETNEKYSPPQILFDDETVESAIFEGLNLVLKELFVL